MHKYTENTAFKRKGLGFDIHRLKPGEAEDEHTHDFIEIVFTLRGKRTHFIDGKSVKTGRGDVLFINYGRTHSYDTGEDAVMYNILLVPEFLDGNFKDCRDAMRLLDADCFEKFKAKLGRDDCVCSLRSGALRDAEALLRSLDREFGSEREGGEEIMRAYMTAFLILLFREMSMLKEAKNVKKKIDVRVFDYIKENYREREKVSLASLAKMCHYHPSYFSRVFAEQAGVTLTEYICSLKIKGACELLEKSRKNIDEIAHEVGFSDKTAFYREFRACMGMSPDKYRKSKNQILSRNA